VGGGHPQVFGAVASRSADIYFEVTHVPWLAGLVNASWLDGFRGPLPGNGTSWFCYGLAAAYSPNARKKPYYCDLPIRFPTGELIDEIWQKWLYFDPLVAYERYVEAFRSMHVFTDCGSRDEFHFHLGHRILHQRLKQARVRHVYEEFDGTHGSHSNERTLRTLEWFSGVLPRRKRRS
jgi:enterochelin esterase family protein